MSEKQEETVTPIVVPVYSEEKKNENTLKAKFQRMKMKKNKKPKMVEKKDKVLRQTPHILPFLQIHDDYILLKDGVMDILQITSKDLYSLNDQDLQFLLFSEARFLRSYFSAFKVVALNFPTNTEKQKEYWLTKSEQTEDPIRLRFIERKLFELDFLEKERTNREFFLFIYAKDKEELEDRKKHVVRSNQNSFPLKTLSLDKKQDILFMLNNQNSKL